jgi:hypothetical protein
MSENAMYKLTTTGEIWKLDHIESVPNYPDPITVYVFENGERWAKDLFFKYFVKVSE